jgi:hypothetical protein
MRLHNDELVDHDFDFDFDGTNHIADNSTNHTATDGMLWMFVLANEFCVLLWHHARSVPIDQPGLWTTIAVSWRFLESRIDVLRRPAWRVRVRWRIQRFHQRWRSPPLLDDTGADNSGTDHAGADNSGTRDNDWFNLHG